jgi:DNA repair exonuclease SbcCD nuclease subunit
MGHLHDTDIKNFNHLEGPIAYPGSIELTTSEGIKEAKKGFFEVDISQKEATPNWIQLDTRPQFSLKTDYAEMTKTVDEMLEKISASIRKPIVEIKIHGDGIETDQIQAQMGRLQAQTLRCFWRIISKENLDSSVFLERPNAIDDEMLRLSTDSTGSEQLANFAIKELLPPLSINQIKEATNVILENFEIFKKEKTK